MVGLAPVDSTGWTIAVGAMEADVWAMCPAENFFIGISGISSRRYRRCLPGKADCSSADRG